MVKYRVLMRQTSTRLRAETGKEVKLKISSKTKLRSEVKSEAQKLWRKKLFRGLEKVNPEKKRSTRNFFQSEELGEANPEKGTKKRFRICTPHPPSSLFYH